MNTFNKQRKSRKKEFGFIFLSLTFTTTKHICWMDILVGRRSVEVTQLCPTLCNPVDYSLPGSSVHGILQARILEWVAISFSRGIFPTQGIEPRSPAVQVDSLPTEPPGKPWFSHSIVIYTLYS